LGEVDKAPHLGAEVIARGLMHLISSGAGQENIVAQ
jgi:hypothetical protein